MKAIKSLKQSLITSSLIMTGLSLSACGGSGNSDAAAVAPPTDPSITTPLTTPIEPPANPTSFEPDESKLALSAQNSQQLYIKPDFRFERYKLVDVRLNLGANTGQANLIRLYQVPADISSLEAAASLAASDKPLLYRGFSDEAGHVQQRLELAWQVEKVLLSVQSIGYENQALIEVIKSSPPSGHLSGHPLELPLEPSSIAPYHISYVF